MQRYDHGGDLYSNPGILLDFSVNTNPLGMPRRVGDALVQRQAEFASYPDPHCRSLRRALAHKHHLDEQNILCGNGAADLIFRLCAWKQPRKALTLAPTFSEYERPVLLFGGEIEEWLLKPENDFALTPDFLDVLTDEVNLLFLCNPNNPTGKLAESALVEEIALRCKNHGILLLIDECFIDFTEGHSMAPKLEEFSNILILQAFTKLYSMAGLRLGYLLGQKTLLTQISEYGHTWSVSAPAQIAGMAALAEEPEWTAKTKKLIREERSFMEKSLTQLGLRVFPSDGNVLLLRSEIPLWKPLRHRGILVRDCSNFTGLDHHFIRIGLKTRKHHLALLSAIEEVLHG